MAILSDGQNILVDGTGSFLTALDSIASGFPTSGLVARWEGNSGVVTDVDGVISWTDQQSGLVLSRGQPEHSPLVITSPGGRSAIRIDGSTNMTGSTGTNLPVGTSARTVVVALKYFGFNFFGGFSYGSNVSDQSFGLIVDNNGVMTLDYLNGSIGSTQADPDRWLVVTGTYDGTNLEYFEDNTSIATLTRAINTVFTQINVGRSFSGVTTDVDIGAIFVYNRVLDSTERVQLKNYLEAAYIIDITAPTLTSGSASNATSVTIDYSVTSSEAGGTLYVSSETSSSPLTPTQMRTKTSVPNPGVGGNTGTLSNLSPSTTYYLQFMQDDIAGNASNVFVASSITTLTPDLTAPVLSSPTSDENGSNGYTGTISTDEGNGTIWYVVTSSSSQPSFAQIKNQQDHTGTTAPSFGDTSVSQSGTVNISGSGLASSTTYYIHYAHEDAAENQSNIVTSSSFTTEASVAAQPEAYDVIGDWAYIPNIISANYPATKPVHNKTANTSNFDSVISGAVAGDVILLSDGNYGSKWLTNFTYSSNVTLVSDNYLGAVFSSFVIEGGDNVVLRGIQVTGDSYFQFVENLSIYYCKFRFVDTGTRTYSGGWGNNDTAELLNSLRIEHSIFDREWPTNQGKFHAAILNANKTLNILNSIFIRGSEDGLKLRGWQGGLIKECFFGYCRTPNENHDSSNPSTDFHGDCCQFNSNDFDINAGTVEFCAFISPFFSGFRTSQGLFLKDGAMSNLIIRQCITAPSLNGNAIAPHGSHTNTLIENCDTFRGVIRMSDNDNTARNNVTRTIFSPASDGGESPVTSGNVTYNSENNLNSVYVGTDRADIDSYVLQPSVDQTKGAANLKSLIFARRAAVT